jgi:hypothetical protein
MPLTEALDSFATLSRLLIDLVSGVPVACEFRAIRFGAEVCNLPACFAGPGIRFIKSAKDDRVFASENKLNLIEHADGHCTPRAVAPAPAQRDWSRAARFNARLC